MNSRIDEYFRSQKGRRVAFVGLGRSNLPLIKMFCEAGAVVYACDSRDKDSLGANATLACEYGATLSLGEHYLDDLNVDTVFRTPGMNYNSPLLVNLRDKGVEITSEMELFFSLCPCRIVAVTGSDGKTTTTTIISELLKAEGYNVHLGGNIGTPLMPQIYDISREDFAVVELSSFQLISMKQSPDICVVTNITPNHLDVHRDMAEYIEAKRNVMRYQTEGNIAVLNLENEITSSFAGDAKSDVYFFSSKNRVKKGAYINDGVIHYADDKKDVDVLDISDIRIPGHHNVENFMAAITAVFSLVSIESIQRVAKNFTGVKHRAQFVRELDKVKYYNDSIASSPTRTACGMLSLFEQKLILICGGYDKHIPYEPLGPVICKKVKVLILLGATSDKIEAAVRGASEYRDGEPEILRASSMEEAVELARANAVSGDIVSLSPASASFDMYKDFEQRGEHFMSIVNTLN